MNSYAPLHACRLCVTQMCEGIMEGLGPRAFTTVSSDQLEYWGFSFSFFYNYAFSGFYMMNFMKKVNQVPNSIGLLLLIE